MKLKVPKQNYHLVELYEEVAKQMGHKDASNLEFDCRHINVASNIQDGFFQFYREQNPDMFETDFKTAMNVMLLLSGPKVDENLADDEVEVFSGFIC